MKRNNELEGGLSPDLSDSVNDKTAERGPVTPARKTKGNTNKVFVTLAIVVALAIALMSLSNLLGGERVPSAADVEQAQASESSRIRNMRPQTFDLTLADDRRNPETTPAATATSEPRPAPSGPSFPLDMPGPPQSGSSFTESPPPRPPVPPRLNRQLTGSVSYDFKSESRAEPRAEPRSVKQSRLNDQLTPSVNVATVAHKRLDLTYLLRRGTNIGCTLDTKIVTTQPGLTRCIVSKDVYSANGNTLLIERGSQIIGEQTTSMLKGEARVFVLWTDVETPNGVSIQIDSPSAGPLGESGQEAQIDRHFFERFSSAIMLSMISDSLEIVKDRVSRNQSFQFDNASDTAEDIASIALRDSIDIPPTGYVNQGALLNVMVARDVDFGTVYELVDPYPHLEHGYTESE